MGLALIDVKEEMKDLPPEEWEFGDIIKCVSRGFGYITKGKEYGVLGVYREGTVNILDDDGDEASYAIKIGDYFFLLGDYNDATFVCDYEVREE